PDGRPPAFAIVAQEVGGTRFPAARTAHRGVKGQTHSQGLEFADRRGEIMSRFGGQFEFLHQVQEFELPAESRHYFATTVRELEALGMRLAFYATVRSPRGRESCAAYFLSDDGKCWGSAIW